VIVHSDTIKNRAWQRYNAHHFCRNDILENSESMNNSIRFLIWLGSQFL